METRVPGVYKPVGWFLSSDLDPKSTPLYSSVMRAQVCFSLCAGGSDCWVPCQFPYSVPKNESEALRSYLRHLKTTILDPSNENGSLRIYFSCASLIEDEVATILITDIGLVGLCVLVALIAIGLHTRSSFIAVVGTISILLSFSVAYFLYSAILGCVSPPQDA